MTVQSRAAFVKWGSFSHVNEKVLNILHSRFPEFEIDVLDLNDVVSRRDRAMQFYCLKEYGAEVVRGRQTISSAYMRTPFAFKRIRQSILQWYADRNYAFTFQTQSTFDAALPGVPHFVYTDHTHLANLSYPGFDPKRLYSKAWIECERTIYQNATISFTMSSNITRSIIEDYSCDGDNVVCVYCGANVEDTGEKTPDISRFARKNILFVGVEWRRKGGPVLVEAFREVLMTHPDAKLTIVGCNPTLDLPNCEIVGRVPEVDVSTYYRNASIYCLPTTIEPFGISTLEAMAHSLPVVASNIGAIPDIVSDGVSGYLVEPNDPRQLRDAILKLIGSSSDCAAFGKLGHDLCMDRYNWDATGVRMSDVMRRFVDA